MDRQKRRLSSQAMACYILAVLSGLLSFIVPAVVSAILDGEAQHLPTDLQKHLERLGEHASLRDLAQDETLQAYVARQELISTLGVIASTIVPVALTALFARGGRAAQANLNAAIMRQRSAEVRDLTLQAVRKGSRPLPFFLYLRPFYADEIYVANPRASSLPFLPAYYYPPAVRWETLFVEQVEALGDVLALGTASDSITADRIESSDESWVHDFVLLASYAKCIFIWPSTRSGTRWEVEWLRDNKLLRKCIFVIPDRYDRWHSHLEENWDAVRGFLLDIGIQTPRETGVLFVTQDETLIVKKFKIAHRSALRSTLAELILAACEARESEKPHETWREAEMALHDEPPSFKTDLSLLPCVECGQILTNPVCDFCERSSSNRG